MPYVQLECMSAVEDKSALCVDLGAGAEKARLQDGGLVLQMTCKSCTS